MAVVYWMAVRTASNTAARVRSDKKNVYLVAKSVKVET